MEQLNIFDLPTRGLICGSTGQGKSTLLYNLIKGPLHKKFDRIYLFTINLDYDPKYKKMKINPKRCFDDYNVPELEYIFHNKKPDGKQWLIILDDVMAEKDFNSNSPNTILNKIMVLGRLRGISLIASVQKCCCSSTVLRNNINWLVVFPTLYKTEIEAIHKICAINSETYFKRMFHQIVKDSQYNAFLYDRRQSNLLEQIYKLQPEKKDDDDPDSYNYRLFKMKYEFEY